MKSIEVLTEADFFQRIRDKLQTRHPRRALVYIHGYNTSFEEAAIRAAQIGYDLKVEGITAMFSWPSQDRASLYPADEASVGASEPFLEKFLKQVLNRSGAKRVDIIAHSMGNRALLRVAGTLPRGSIGQIILAAPDVDAGTFRNLANAYSEIAERTTLYVSSRDVPLDLSSWLHDYPRAGFAPPITVVDGINTVEVSRIDLTALGHRYFAEAKELLYDIYELLSGNRDPSQRLRLVETQTPNGHVYYRFRQ